MAKSSSKSNATKRLHRAFVETSRQDSLHHARCLTALLQTLDFTKIEVDEKTMCGHAIIMTLIDILLEKAEEEQ